MAAAPRPGPWRVADTLATLALIGADTWVSTASPAGVAHLVPLSYAWDGRRILLAAQPSSATVRNLEASGRARLGFGPTRDVVIVDARLEEVTDVPQADPPVLDAYARQAGWDPRDEGEPYTLLSLRPVRIQAWREANELEGRLLMRDGAWLFEAARPAD